MNEGLVDASDVVDAYCGKFRPRLRRASAAISTDSPRSLVAERCHSHGMPNGDVGLLQRAPRPFTVGARLRSFGYAWNGLKEVVASQHNAWVHFVATVAVVTLGVVTRVSRAEWLALVFAIVLVWAAEALNTAFELLCDAVSPEHHPLVGRAKDVAAGAVLVCAAGAVVVAGVVFLPRLV
jgi:diacylglycerol kinase (ATP)